MLSTPEGLQIYQYKAESISTGGVLAVLCTIFLIGTESIERTHTSMLVCQLCLSHVSHLFWLHFAWIGFGQNRSVVIVKGVARAMPRVQFPVLALSGFWCFVIHLRAYGPPQWPRLEHT